MCQKRKLTNAIDSIEAICNSINDTELLCARSTPDIFHAVSVNLCNDKGTLSKRKTNRNWYHTLNTASHP